MDAPNVFAPTVTRFQLQNNNAIQLWFDQQMDEISLSQPTAYTIESSGNHPILTVLNPEDASFVELQFDQAFEPGNVY